MIEDWLSLDIVAGGPGSDPLKNIVAVRRQTAQTLRGRNELSGYDFSFRMKSRQVRRYILRAGFGFHDVRFSLESVGMDGTGGSHYSKQMSRSDR
jgi:hypothetical protein